MRRLPRGRCGDHIAVAGLDELAQSFDFPRGDDIGIATLQRLLGLEFFQRLFVGALSLPNRTSDCPGSVMKNGT